MTKKWFKAAIGKRPPYNLGGWSKSQTEEVRRRKALASRPKTWSLRRRYLSAGRALIALSNVSQDPGTRKKARADAKHFFAKLR